MRFGSNNASVRRYESLNYELMLQGALEINILMKIWVCVY